MAWHVIDLLLEKPIPPQEFPSPALTFLRPTSALVPKMLAAEDHFRDGKFQSFESYSAR